MLRTKFFDNPEYCEYVRMLLRLRDLISHGDNEDPKAESLRDQMDAYGEGFTAEEIESLHGIAGDIYSLSLSRPLRSADIAEVSDKMLEQIEAEIKSGQFVAALDRLRDHRHRIHPSQLARMRGHIMNEAGLPDMAERFYNAATRFATPDSPKQLNPLPAAFDRPSRP